MIIKLFVFLSFQNSNVMERPRRSGIPVPKRVAPKPHHPVSPEIPIPKRTSPGHDSPVSPPLSPPLSPENGVTEQDFDQVWVAYIVQY